MWDKYQVDFMPPEALLEASRGDLAPERAVLNLPSDFSYTDHCWLGLEGLADAEVLRLGQANDALKKLREVWG
jgi:hypothetical protein